MVTKGAPHDRCAVICKVFVCLFFFVGKRPIFKSYFTISLKVGLHIKMWYVQLNAPTFDYFKKLLKTTFLLKI